MGFSFYNIYLQTYAKYSFFEANERVRETDRERERERQTDRERNKTYTDKEIALKR